MKKEDILAKIQAEVKGWRIESIEDITELRDGLLDDLVKVWDNSENLSKYDNEYLEEYLEEYVN